MKNILFTFESMKSGDKAMSALAKAFARAGANVIGNEVDAKTKRTAGISYREVHLTFVDGQRVSLSVKQSGDIFAAKVNGKVVPLKNPDDHGKAVAELVKVMDAGRAKFQQALAKTRAELPKGIKTAAPKMEQALQARVEELDKAIAEAEQTVSDLKAELGETAMDSAALDAAKSITENAIMNFATVRIHTPESGGKVKMTSDAGEIVVTKASDGSYRFSLNGKSASMASLVAAIKDRKSIKVLDDAALDGLKAAGNAKQQVKMFADRYGLKISTKGAGVTLSNPKSDWFKFFDDFDEAFSFLMQAKDDHEIEGKPWVFDSASLDAAKPAPYMAFNVDSGTGKYIIIVKNEDGMTEADARRDAMEVMASEMGRGANRVKPGAKPLTEVPEEAWEAKGAKGWGWVMKGSFPVLDNADGKMTRKEAEGLFVWRDLGQRDGIKTIALFMKDPENPGSSTSQMKAAEVWSEAGRKGWFVDEGSKTYSDLATAKKAAMEAGMKRASEWGYVALDSVDDGEDESDDDAEERAEPGEDQESMFGDEEQAMDSAAVAWSEAQIAALEVGDKLLYFGKPVRVLKIKHVGKDRKGLLFKQVEFESRPGSADISTTTTIISQDIVNEFVQPA